MLTEKVITLFQLIFVTAITDKIKAAGDQHVLTTINY